MAQYRCDVKCWKNRKMYKRGHFYPFNEDPGKHFTPVGVAEVEEAAKVAKPKKHLGMDDIKA